MQIYEFFFTVFLGACGVCLILKKCDVCVNFGIRNHVTYKQKIEHKKSKCLTEKKVFFLLSLSLKLYKATNVKRTS